MLPSERKKLKNYLNKYYWENKQHIYLTTFEVMDKDSCALDVCLCDSKGKTGRYLFEIWNYNAFIDHEYIGKLWDKNHRWYETWDGVAAASRPYYMNKIFCLTHFKGITEEDILSAARKFITEELGCWLMLNFKFIKGEA